MVVRTSRQSIRKRPVRRAKVADFGYGTRPDRRATHGVESFKSDWMHEHMEEYHNDLPEHMRKSYANRSQRRMERLKGGVTEVDFNKRVPFKKNQFSRVVSNFAMNVFAKQNAYHEAFRVMKPGGIIEVVGVETPEMKLQAMKYMIKAGFVNITTAERWAKQGYRKTVVMYGRKPMQGRI